MTNNCDKEKQLAKRDADAMKFFLYFVSLFGLAIIFVKCSFSPTFVSTPAVTTENFADETKSDSIVATESRVTEAPSNDYNSWGSKEDCIDKAVSDLAIFIYIRTNT